MQVLMGNPNIEAGEDLLREIGGIINSGWVSIGEYMEALETHFKELTGVKHAIATSCATQGLVIALKSAGWERGCAVNLPSFTWPSTLYAVNCLGGIPLFHDINPNTWLMEEIHHNHGKLLLVDTFGNMAENDESFNKEDVIVDAAHGYGLPDLGHRGVAEVVSLSFTKVVTGMEGGMILTDDDQLAETAKELRRLTARMTEISALVALKSIEDFDKSIAQGNILSYKKHITVSHRCQHVSTATNNSVFSIVLEDTATRDAIRLALGKAGCETKVYYDPLQDGHLCTDLLYSRILALPIHGGVTEHIEEIIEIINRAGRSARTPGKEFLTR